MIDPITIEQRHRDAAAAIGSAFGRYVAVENAEIRLGRRDDDPVVQAFARFERDHMQRPTDTARAGEGDARRAALIERIGTIADLAASKPLEGELGDVAYDLLRQAAAQISSDRLALNRIASLRPTDTTRAEEWRCFHCGEVFTNETCARRHFGPDEGSVAACVIKAGAEQGLVGALRKAEAEIADAWHAIHSESTEAAKAYYAQQTRHQEQLRLAEESGYEKGLADGRNLASTPSPVTDETALSGEAREEEAKERLAYAVRVGDSVQDVALHVVVAVLAERDAALASTPQPAAAEAETVDIPYSERLEYEERVLAAEMKAIQVRREIEELQIEQLRAKLTIEEGAHREAVSALLEAVAAEREQCAKIAEGVFADHGKLFRTQRANNYEIAGKRIAAAIRQSAKGGE